MTVFPMPPAPSSTMDTDRSTRLNRSSVIISQPKKIVGACGRGGGWEERVVLRILATWVVVDELASETPHLGGSKVGCTSVA